MRSRTRTHDLIFLVSFYLSGGFMTVARVTEITASSKKSFEDALNVGVDRACKTLKNVEGAWIQDQKVVIKGGKIVEYRVNMKVTFILAE
jgi:dodecin